MNSRRKICLAPMMDYTDRHFRYLIRLISPTAWLYTEMVTTGAIIHGDRERHLGFSPPESPVAIQLGGSNPDELAQSAKIASDYGYDEINLNIGCPSDRVQSGKFGVCLMREPKLVAEGLRAMQAETHLPVTVKTRIGVDNEDSYAFLTAFVDELVAAGCSTFIIHARKAWLKGLSPKENREVPPLNYERVYQLKRDYPALEIILNGGVVCKDDVTTHLSHVDGVMVGREAVSNPMCFADYEHGDMSIDARYGILEKYVLYAEQQMALGTPLGILGKPLLGLFNKQINARKWRRSLSEEMYRPEKKPELFLQAADRLYNGN